MRCFHSGVFWGKVLTVLVEMHEQKYVDVRCLGCQFLINCVSLIFDLPFVKTEGWQTASTAGGKGSNMVGPALGRLASLFKTSAFAALGFRERVEVLRPCAGSNEARSGRMAPHTKRTA